MACKEFDKETGACLQRAVVVVHRENEIRNGAVDKGYAQYLADWNTVCRFDSSHPFQEIFVDQSGLSALNKLSPNVGNRCRLNIIAYPAFDNVVPVHQSLLDVERCQRHGVRIEDLADLISDQIIDRLNIQLGSKPAYTVDNGKLRVALLGFIEQLRIIDGGCAWAANAIASPACSSV
jgi:hypothetical protein